MGGTEGRVSQQGGSRTEIAKVSQIDYQKGLVKLAIPSKDETVTNWIPYPSFEYEMPKVGDTVLYLPENTNYTNPYYFGLCLGRYYNKNELPKLQGPEIYYKPMLGDVTLIYHADKKRLTIQTDQEIEIKAVEQISIQAKKIVLEAQGITLNAESIGLTAESVSIIGETSIQGNLTVSGMVSAAQLKGEIV